MQQSIKNCNLMTLTASRERSIEGPVAFKSPGYHLHSVQGAHGVKTHSRRGRSTASSRTGDSPGQPKLAPPEGGGAGCRGATLTAEQPVQVEAAAGAANIDHALLQATGPLQPLPTAGPVPPTSVFDLPQSPATASLSRSSGNAGTTPAAPPCDQVGPHATICRPIQFTAGALHRGSILQLTKLKEGQAVLRRHCLTYV